MPSLFSLISILAVISTVANAAPLAIERRAVSQGLLGQLSFFEQYSAAAYCSANNVAMSDTAITCEAGNCPQVQAAGAESILEFENQGAADSTGFVALDHTNQLIVISFRGSTSFLNYVADVNVAMVPFLCTGCTAHAGFLDSWSSAKPQILTAVASARQSYPSYAIVSTGHSLGGAIATLAAADLRANSGYDVELYTYGSPMTSNYLLATFITNQSSQNYRVTHAQDIVPHLPGYPVFAHVSPEYWITSASNVAVTADAIKVSTGVIDLAGNQGQLSSNVPDHLWYFNAISACSPGFSLAGR